MTDKQGRILIPDVTIDGSKYILVHIYNANIESEQLKVLNDLSYNEKGQYNTWKADYFSW